MLENPGRETRPPCPPLPTPMNATHYSKGLEDSKIALVIKCKNKTSLKSFDSVH